MRTLLLLWLFVAPGADTLQVMFWNVENFFDWRNDSTTVSDVEFSAAGERHWTWKRFQAKANAFAKALFWVEAEGIDVALLYRSSRLELLDSKPCHLFSADTVMATRDILLCVFRRAGTPFMPDPDRASIATFQEIPGQAGNDGAFAVLVNHHPSKYGGAAESEPRRRIAVERLRFLADSLAAVGIDRIIAGGDFNDTPDNPVFGLLEPVLRPMHMDLFRRGLGTIKFDGKWDLIDHIYVSPALTPLSLMRILRIPFLLTRDTVHSGEKPLRTYTGPRHTGGVSDHLPVLLEVRFQ